ncbi:hypothetical protein AHF37_06908 [Paragonimus kellicotti]|nr:hypothetical protein AHF37_06908 [Paragonimus kellicotti]
MSHDITSTLLPKRSGDFAKREYWDQFFNSRRSTFEWYGDFVQHSSFFNKYVKKSDSVLIVGCGNSELGLMLHDQIGCSSVLNIDNSELVIRQMLTKAHHVDMRPGLRYECLDLFHLKERIVLNTLNPVTCVIDKGTLDAVHSDESSEETASKVFDNVTSTLKVMGRYIIITLAQEHIVKSICRYFLRSSHQWLVNCHQLTTTGSNGQDMNFDEVAFCLPLFGFVMTKLLPSTELPRVFVYHVACKEAKSLHSSPDHPTNLEHQLITWISQEQSYSLLRRDISSGDQTSFRFACPVTGLTIFHCAIIRTTKHAKLPQRGPNPVRNVSAAIDAVFLVPFGQNRRLCGNLLLQLTIAAVHWIFDCNRTDASRCMMHVTTAVESSFDGLMFDTVFYDPSAVTRSMYRLLFSADSLDKLRDACSVHLKNEPGYLVVCIESALSECDETEVDCALVRTHLTATRELEHVLQYSIPDSLMADPPTTVLVFRSITNQTSADETRIDLLRRIEYFLRKKEGQKNDLLTAACNVLKSIL